MIRVIPDAVCIRVDGRNVTYVAPETRARLGTPPDGEALPSTQTLEPRTSRRPLMVTVCPAAGRKTTQFAVFDGAQPGLRFFNAARLRNN